MGSVTSALYDEIYERGNWIAESKLDVYSADGTTLVHSFGKDRLISMTTTRALVPNEGLSVGNTIVGEIEVVLYPTDENDGFVIIPKNATLKPYFRLIDNLTGDISEWLQKGIFNIETRESDFESGQLTIRGYDPMRKLEFGIRWDDVNIIDGGAVAMLSYLAGEIGVSLDERIYDYIDPDEIFRFYPKDGEVLGSEQSVLSARYILGSFCGVHFANAFITNDGKLMVLPINPTAILENNSASVAVDFVFCDGADKIHRKDSQKISGVNAIFNAFGGENSQMFGTTESVVLNIPCPFFYLTDSTFTGLLNDYHLWYDYPYSAENALISPHADLGDIFRLSNDLVEHRAPRYLYRQTLYFGPLMRSDVSSPRGDMSEFENEYQGAPNYEGSYQTQADRNFAARPTFDQVGGAVYGGALTIPQGADLNDYTDPGIYAVPNNAVAGTLTHSPTSHGGRVVVVSALGRRYTASTTNIYIRQIYETYDGTIYQRRADSSTGWANLSWKNWNVFATQSYVDNLLFDAGTELVGTETLTSLSIGKYEAKSINVAAALQSVATGNCPTGNNFSLIVYNRLSTPRKGLIITDSQGDVYVKQQSTASGWTSWMKLTSTAV